jgi:transposase
MARTSRLLSDRVAAIAEANLEKLGKTGAVAIKLRAVTSAHKHGITTVANIFGTTKATLISWIKHVKAESIELLKVQEGRGRESVLNQSHKEMIKKLMSEDSQITIDKVRARMIQETGVSVGRSTVHRAMKQVGFSYITPTAAL